ncbi:MAG: phospholipase D family protein [Deltaproteobacteria bacterium]|nr:phospholipase D family protein [Deltaproteobacteria bacterium]
MPKRPYKVLAPALASLIFLAALSSGCAALPLDYPRSVSSALLLPEKTKMGQRIQPHVVKHQGKSGFYLLPSGDDAFLARVLAIESAERTLDLQYYIFEDDLTGKFMMDRLVAAAERGVRVRLLLDDWKQAGKSEWGLAMVRAYPNIEVRVFNPFGGLRSFFPSRVFQAVFVAKRLRARMHNKLFIVDNSLAIVGGRNIADEYFGGHSEILFGDLDIMAIGPITRELSTTFDHYWNSVLSIPINALLKKQPTAAEMERYRQFLAENRRFLQNSQYAEDLKDAKLRKRVEAGRLSYVWAEGEVLYDDPLKVIHQDDTIRISLMGRQLRAMVDAAQSEVLIISAYFIPGKRGMQWFKKLRDRGVTIKVLTNSLASTDVPIAQGGYEHYRKELLRMGVELYELKPDPDRYRFWNRTSLGSSSRGSLHAKAIIVDRKVVFVGSFNLDPRSATLNTENGIVVRSVELGTQATHLFDRGIAPQNAYQVAILGEPQEKGNGLVWITEENGREVRHYKNPETGFWCRFEVRVLYLLAPESSL